MSWNWIDFTYVSSLALDQISWLPLLTVWFGFSPKHCCLKCASLFGWLPKGSSPVGIADVQSSERIDQRRQLEGFKHTRAHTRGCPKGRYALCQVGQIYKWRTHSTAHITNRGLGLAYICRTWTASAGNEWVRWAKKSWNRQMSDTIQEKNKLNLVFRKHWNKNMVTTNGSFYAVLPF